MPLILSSKKRDDLRSLFFLFFQLNFTPSPYCFPAIDKVFLTYVKTIHSPCG